MELNMGKKVILISKKSKECNQLHTVLSKNNYGSYILESIAMLDNELTNISCNCVILDLDSINIDNRDIRELTIEYPHLYFLCISKDRFHPELKDAICYHIYACLTKPLDYDELLYWLRCIDDNGVDSIPPKNNKES